MAALVFQPATRSSRECVLVRLVWRIQRCLPVRRIASRNGHFRWTWCFDLTKSRKDKARLIVQLLIRKAVCLRGSSHIERRASSSKTGQPSANSSQRRSDLFTKKTLVLPCSHCFRLDLLTSTSGRFHTLAYVFPTSMNFRERCCLFEVFRISFDAMLCVNIQKTCLRQLGQQEKLAVLESLASSPKECEYCTEFFRNFPANGQSTEETGPGSVGATEAWGSLFQLPERRSSVQGLSWVQPKRPSPITGAVIGERRSACTCV